MMPLGRQIKERVTGGAATSAATASGDDPDKLVVFISYSRSDTAFADRLVAALDARGFNCKIDRRHLEYGQKWQEMLADFIADADTVVFVVSPRSIKSKWCRWELAQVAEKAKRVVPVVLEAIAPEPLPPEIGDWHLMPFGPDADFETEVARLAEVLVSDREWVKQHTRLAGLAATWDREKRRADALIQGQSLIAAERWKATPRKLKLRPSALVEAFVSESRAEETRHARRRSRIAWGVTAGALALACVAIWQWRAAVASEQVAVRERNGALAEQSRVQAARAEDKIRDGRAGEGLKLAIDALPGAGRDRPYVPAAEAALNHALWKTRERAVIEAGKDALDGLDLSADGRHLLTWSTWGELRLWDAPAVTQERKLADKVTSIHDGVDAVVFASFDRVGGRVIATSLDHTARLWPSLVAPDVRLVGHSGPVRHAAFSPDGRLVVTASDDDTARVWRTDDGKPLAVLEGHLKRVTHVTFDANGTRIATASEDNTARIWSTEHFALIAVVQHPAQVGFTRFSPDGSLLLVVSKPASVTVGRLLARDPVADTASLYAADSGARVAPLTGHADQIVDAEFSADSSKFLTVSEDGTARIWSAPGWDTGDIYSDLPAEAYAERDGLRSGRFMNGGHGIITVGSDRKIRIWTLSNRTPVAVLDVHMSYISALAISADRSVFATASGDGTARLFSTESRDDQSQVRVTGEPLMVSLAAMAHDGALLVGSPNELGDSGRLPSSVRIGDTELGLRPFGLESPDGGRVALVRDSEVQLLDPRSGERVATLVGHTAVVSGVEFSRDGRHLATMCGRVAQPLGFGPRGKDATARIWDAATGQPVAVLAAHGANVERVRFASKTGKVATASHDSRVRVWTLPDGRLERVLEGHGGPVLDLAFSPDESLLATVSSDGTGRLWRVADGGLLAELKGHTGAIELVAFSPDGRVIVTASRDSTARLWSAASGKLLRVLDGSGNDLNYAAFVADGKRVVTAIVDPAKYDGDGAFGSWLNERFADRAIVIWDVASGDALQHLQHEDAIQSVAIHDDGRLIVSASGALHLWRLHTTTEESVEAAYAALPRRAANVEVSPSGPSRHTP